MLIQGTVFMCETSFSPVSPLPVNLVTTFHQYRRDMTFGNFIQVAIMLLTSETTCTLST